MRRSASIRLESLWFSSALISLTVVSFGCSSMPMSGPDSSVISMPDSMASETTHISDVLTSHDAPDVRTVSPDASVRDVMQSNPDVTHVVDPCIAAGTCPPGTWVNITPPNANLLEGSCSNYGALSVQVDPARPEAIYAHVDCQGVWKSTDYGSTWAGPLTGTGPNAATAADCAGGITVVSVHGSPVIYESCIRGTGYGFWRSTNDGTDWTRYNIAPAGPRQDVYPPSVDPYDPNHLLMAGHENNLLVESTDGGETWTQVITQSPAMDTSGGTSVLLFVNTGVAATTRTTWLFLPQATGGIVGTWRTETGGGANAWTRVDSNEKEHSYSQLFQPNLDGVVLMAGLYSGEGFGVLRSTDYGVHWVHVGVMQNENIVFGTSRHIYAMDGTGAENFEVADLPGDGTWTSLPTPAGMMGATSPSGPVSGSIQAAVTTDGTRNIIFTANMNNGIWRYVEP